jgi:hypothetical protein
MSAAAELQKAVFAALTGDAALIALLGGEPRVYDHTPAHVAFPYITFGRTSGFNWDTGTENGQEHLFTLHIWSNAKGKAESLALIEAIQTRLHDAPLTLTGYALVNVRQEFSESRFDEDLAVYHGLVRFRAVTEG